MKIVVDIKGELKKDDIIVFDGENFKPVAKDEFLCKLSAQNADLCKEIEKLRIEIDAFKLGVNNKLKDYHNILQTLTKEE